MVIVINTLMNMASWRKEKKKIKRNYLRLTINGKKVTAWMDFELYKKEQEWYKQKELELAKNWMAGLLPFQCGIPPDNRHYPLTHFVMANIITKDKATRESVERHMRNSVEYTNPNLKVPLKTNFPQVTMEDRTKAQNVIDVTALAKRKTHISLGAVVVDHKFNGYITYRIKPIDWSQEETKLEFQGIEEFIIKLNKI